MKEAKLIAYGLGKIDTTLCFLGFIYAINHGCPIIGYWMLFSAVLDSVLGFKLIEISANIIRKQKGE